MARYVIEHVTRFTYAGPVRESVMELRMCPRESGGQSCERFALSLTPSVALREYVDAFGNLVHYFTLPQPHDALAISAGATVDVNRTEAVPRPDLSWDEIAETARERENFRWLAESHFARSTPLLDSFAAEALPDASLAPVPWLMALRDRIRELLRYARNSTRADSPIDDCLTKRAGVCQDFAHVFIALARRRGVPCRYVSGYLFHRESDTGVSGEDATHAWVEAYLPGFGWWGLDAANGIDASERHIRVAVGRDYHDVPPTRGVYRGPATRDHDVRVRVQRVGSSVEPSEENNRMTAFQCQVQAQPGCCVVQIAGTLGAADCAALEQQLRPALAANPSRVILDLSGLESLGSAGIGALVKIQRSVEASGGKLVLAAVPDRIQKVFSFSKLDRVFLTAPGVAEARQM